MRNPTWTYTLNASVLNPLDLAPVVGIASRVWGRRVRDTKQAVYTGCLQSIIRTTGSSYIYVRAYKPLYNFVAYKRFENYKDVCEPTLASRT